MGVEKTERPRRKKAVLALAAALALLAAAPATAAPSGARADEGSAPALLKVWEGAWGWLTAVWGKQGHTIDPDGATSTAGEQGHTIDPDGGKRESDTSR